LGWAKHPLINGLVSSFVFNSSCQGYIGYVHVLVELFDLV
jgi:hypothetical protein